MRGPRVSARAPFEHTRRAEYQVQDLSVFTWARCSEQDDSATNRQPRVQGSDTADIKSRVTVAPGVTGTRRQDKSNQDFLSIEGINAASGLRMGLPCERFPTAYNLAHRSGHF